MTENARVGRGVLPSREVLHPLIALVSAGDLPRSAALDLVSVDACPALGNAAGAIDPSAMVSTGIRSLLSAVSVACGKKPLVFFFDEVDCLVGPTLITFLRQLRNGKIDMGKGKSFPKSVALIGMRDIRDYKAQIRPEPEAVRLAVEFSGGQPYLANALARWCVEKIHGERYGETITAADMCEAKEKIEMIPIETLRSAEGFGVVRKENGRIV